TQPEARRRVLRPRVIAYSLILLAVAVALAASMLTRSTLRMDIIRDRGVLGREVPGGLIENIYRLQIMNTAELPLTLHLNADGVEGVTISTVDTERTTVDIAPASNQLVPIVVRVPAGNLEPGLHDISITAEGKSPDGQVRSVNEATRFYVPN
ncbi:MAG TPA: FixG Ig-like domain-containing protein, partial [Burkholderiaceae bacterium]|nr:FixG Ig-like domain-containing protein [Burkholderiaceae bacterium]